MRFSTSLRNLQGSFLARCARMTRRTAGSVDIPKPAHPIETLPDTRINMFEDRPAKPLNESPSEPSIYSEDSASFSASNSSGGTTWEQPLTPNLRLFRGSQADFGFDVYIPYTRDHRGLAFVYPCPEVLPWDELTAVLAVEAGRDKGDIALCNKMFPFIVDNEVSYEAWLEWSKGRDGPCTTDLWLV